MITLGGIGFAMYCGTLTGKGQNNLLALILTGGLAMTILLTKQSMIWMGIPIFWNLQGQIPLLPVPFSVRDLIVMAVFAGYLGLKALKIVRRKPAFEPVDLLVLAMVLYLVSCYIRNPVGVEALGTDRVGGRPYFNVFIGVLAYWVLSRAVLPLRSLHVLVFAFIGSRLVEAMLNAITLHIPSTVPYLSQLYTGIDPTSYTRQDVRMAWAATGESSQRQTYLSAFGGPIVLALCAYFRPLTLITPLFFVRFLLFAFGMLCVLYSGYRSLVITLFMVFVIASYFRGGRADVVRTGLIVAPLLGLLLLAQGTLIQLPVAAQRALSFLPGRWDPVAVAAARDSSEWRFHMWKQMLSTDKYIANKLLGDGFGFSQQQLRAIYSLTYTAGTLQQQETFMITGQVHSGPISTIRFVGYVGLVVFLALLIFCAHFAWQIVRRSQPTPYFPVALFFCIPLIWEPFNFVFVFGAFDAAVPNVIMNVGLIKMLSNSLHDYEAGGGVKSEDAPARVVRRVERPRLTVPAPAGAHRFHT